jgi:hypothetical protein
MRILVSGMLAGDPGQGGASWAVLQYVLGFQRLGHDVWFVEPVGNMSERVTRYFRAVSSKYRLGGCAALLNPSTGETYGVARDGLEEACRGADIHLNIAGMLQDEGLIDRIPVRVYVDLDPAFTQLWASQGIDMRLDGHSHFVTVGLAVGTSDCAVPTLGRAWLTMLPPVVLEHWRLAGAIRFDGFTTVGNWRSYGAIDHGGVRYGVRAHSVRQLLDLPARTREPIMPALAIHPDEVEDLGALAANGWHLLSAEQVASTPARYHDFVQGSKAELGVAKEGYVLSRCGWFSDRSACYLASGRPVLLEETGFSAFLPTHAGLLAYSSTADAALGIEDICSDYGRHRHAARTLAEEWLDSDVVLGRLLEAL